MNFKRLFFTVAAAVATMAAVAQTSGFAYQAVVRNSQGELISSTDVKLQLTLTAADGTVLYQERQKTKTNDYGVLSVTVGTGEAVQGSFSEIDWAKGGIAMKVEIDTKGGDNYTDLGITKLQAVPYAYFAANSPNSKGEQGDKGADGVGIESVSNSEGMVTINLTNGQTYTYNLKGEQGEQGDKGADGVGIANITFTDNVMTVATTDGKSFVSGNLKGEPGTANLQIEGTKGQTLGHDGTTWVATDEIAVKKLDVKADTKTDANSEEALFEVKDKDGNVVFAVYPNAVRVFVDEEAEGKDGDKAMRTGFAVAGRRAAKEGANSNIFAVNADGTTVYIDDEGKAMRTGFAVAGRRAAKEGEDDDKYLKINNKGTTVFIDNDDTKAMRTGFAVAGRRAAKEGETNDYFSVNTEGTQVYFDDSDNNQDNSKAIRTGFAVAGRRAAKDGEASDYFSVNTEGTQVYFDDSDSNQDNSKAMRTGFAVAGRRAAKEGMTSDDYLTINNEGTTVFIDENEEGSKPIATGFAVAGRRAAKDGKDQSNYFAVDTKGTTGDNTAALGQYAEAEGIASTAMGYYASASGDYSTAFGEGSASVGEGSFAAGNYSIATGSYSTSLGQYSQASGEGSFAAGSFSSAIGDVSLAIGQGASAKGEYAMAIGSNAIVDSSPVVTYLEVLGGCIDCVVVDSFPSSSSFAIGSNAQALGEGVMAIGNGATATGRFSFAIGDDANAYGYSSIAMGPGSIANGQASIAIGSDCESYNAGVTIGYSAYADSAGAFAIGTDCDASGWASVALGKSTHAKGSSSFSIGESTESLGECSYAIGFWTKTKGKNSLAIGNYVQADGEREIVMGELNDTTLYSGHDRIFTIGNGHGWYDRNNAFVVEKSGNVGIGTSTPSYELEVNGTIKANNISEASDIRLKRDVTPLNNSLQKVLQLRGVNYYWKSEEEIKTVLGTHEKCQYPETKQVGVIAQEVEEVVPEVVATDAKGFKSVDYSKLVPVLIEAIKEQQNEIEELKKMVEELKNK